MRSLSSRAYFLIFLIAGGLCFGALAVSMLYRMERVSAVVQEEQLRAANEELERGVQLVIKDAARIGRELAEWDEVHQQLVNSAYYLYWRDQRLRQNLPRYVEAVELYRAEGSALAAENQASLPTEGPAGTHLMATAQGMSLYLSVPIHSRQNATRLAGHVALKLDFLEALRVLNRFVYLDAESLAVLPSHVGELAVEEALGALAFRPLGTPSARELERVMTDALRQLAVLLAVMALSFYLIVTKVFGKPLQQLERHIDALRRGRPSVLSGRRGPLLPVTEMETLRRSLNEYQSELDRVHARLDKQNVELWSLAHMDPLTGVSNRRAFDQDWQSLKALAHGQRVDIAFMLFDCDFFKAINDTYGHVVGDRVIEGIAKSLSAALRKGDQLYRLGGDEFAALLVNADTDSANAIARRCQEAIAQHPFAKYGVREPIKISIGIAHTSGMEPGRVAELAREADIAMYHAKRTSRNSVVHYQPTMQGETVCLVSNRIVNAVLMAVESGCHLEMHYQPIVRVDGWGTDYYEALMRIRDEEGLIGPGDILPVIARRGLEAELDLAVIQRIYQDLQEGRIPDGIGVSINVSGALLATPDFCERIRMFREHVETRKVIIEVTETALITQLQPVSENLRALRDCGFLVALDDFGSGYSSIRYLANMPVDIVKFDIAMTRALNSDQRTRRMIEDTTRLILNAGYQLVAEGIETEALRDTVVAIGATHLQGYLFGKPEPRAPKL